MSDTTTKLTYLVGAKRLQEKNLDTEYLLSQEQLEMFEALALADEREACAKLAEKLTWADNIGVASAIRARGNT